MGELYSIGSLVSTGTPSFQLDQLTSPAVDLGLEILSKRGAGQPDPSFAGILAAKPIYTFTTEELTTLLTNVPAYGCFHFGEHASASDAVLTAFFTKYQQGCARASGDSHFTVQFNQGMVVVRSISAAQDGIASAQCSLLTYLYDTTVPVEFPADDGLPTVSVDEQFTMGPVKINGTLYDEDVQRWEFDSGITTYQRGASGSIYPLKIGIQTRAPSFKVFFDDLTLARSITALGTAQGGSATEFFLRRKTKHAANVADATTSHIKLALSASQGMITIQEIAGDDFSQLGLLITPTTGTGAAVIPTLGVAIS